MDVGFIIAFVVALQLAVIFGFVLLERREPQATLAWILGVVLIPVIGVFLYLLLGLSRSVKRHRASARVVARTRAVFGRWEVARKARGRGTSRRSQRTRALTALGERASDAHACPGNRANILIDAAQTYAAMQAAIAGARHHVHVQFYIIQPDDSGRALRDQLVIKAAAGVEVRVICDALGSLRLPSDFWQPLLAAGGRAAYFGRIRLAPLVRRRDHVNFRNHRKIMIVDGLIGLTGGINIGREYLGLDPAFGAWRDTHLRIEGPATLGLQQTFVEDWLVTTGELLDGAPYFPEPEPAPPTLETERPRLEHGGDIRNAPEVHGFELAPSGAASAAGIQGAESIGRDTIVQCVASGPDRPWAVIHQMYALGIAYADRRVWATSPYFVPDRVMQMALVTAALRGVDVRLLVPKKSDSRLVDLASRYYFPELLEAGVRIFEYGAGFLHAKTLVVDDWLTAIGSSNMDIRSFQLNYELTAFVYDRRVTEVLAAQYEADLARAIEVPKSWTAKLSYGRRLLHAAAGLLSPLL